MLNHIAASWKSLHQHHRLTSPMNSIMNFVLNSEGSKRQTPTSLRQILKKKIEPDLMSEDPNIPLQRREDQGPVDPEFKGTVKCLSREKSKAFWKPKMMH